jgi:hypothetical protein
LRVAATIALIALAATAAPALAAGTSISVTPHSVQAGQRVVVSGSAGDCPKGDRVTLLSKAFSHRHDFAGVPAVFARVKNGGRFGHSVRIPAGIVAGRYSISARCGGGNLGATAHVRVTRSSAAPVR